MKFWAIAYQYQEDIYYDLESGEDVFSLEHTCLLPTRELAKIIIEDELSTDYIPVEINFESLSKNGVWSYTRGPVERWDEEFDGLFEEDEEEE
jgi:hypothetical protein